MRISYDKAADALYIQLTANPPRDSMDIEDGVTADLDDQGHVVGLEVLDAHARLGREAMAHLRIEWLAGGDVLKVEDGSSNSTSFSNPSQSNQVPSPPTRR